MMIDVQTVEARRLAASVEELLAGAERREPFVNPDGRSTAAFERVWIGGRPHIVKYAHLDDDFTMRVSGDLVSRPVRAWAAGLLDAAPDLVDHAVLGAALGFGRNGWGAALLMRDVSDDLVAVVGAPFTPDEHDLLIDRLAGWCAATWGFRDDPVTGPHLLPYEARWAWFGRTALDGERALGWPERVPAIAAEGWERFTARVPRDVAAVIDELWRDCTPLADALRTTPSCLLHGDPKASNMGITADGRMVLIDWAYVGEGPAGHELGWYLALNREKLPVTKEATIDAFRLGLERRGVDTAGWWERQVGLCLLGALVLFGWEKAYGDDDELAWWCDAAREGARFL
jgi:hypothetical protein